MNDDEFKNKAREVILYLWDNRKYGIKEMEYWYKVCELVPDELIGVRPIDENGMSIIPHSV